MQSKTPILDYFAHLCPRELVHRPVPPVIGSRPSKLDSIETLREPTKVTGVVSSKRCCREPGVLNKVKFPLTGCLAFGPLAFGPPSLAKSRLQTLVYQPWQGTKCWQLCNPLRSVIWTKQSRNRPVLQQRGLTGGLWLPYGGARLRSLSILTCGF